MSRHPIPSLSKLKAISTVFVWELTFPDFRGKFPWPIFHQHASLVEIGHETNTVFSIDEVIP